MTCKLIVLLLFFILLVVGHFTMSLFTTKISPRGEFCPGLNSILCVVKPLTVFTTKKPKKNSPRGELTPSVLTGVKFSPWGELTSNELYMHVFTRPGVTCCSVSAFSRSFSNICCKHATMSCKNHINIFSKSYPV